ncbi:hypothetical protein ACJ2CR_16280 [Myxococcus faecalis]|uniref:hypothetical protein n=1 Tax=Myxococcus TaxID=32 RepID=UPI001CBC8680
MYTSGSGLPEHVSERPWRGVYHHWDGYPTGLGQHLPPSARREPERVRSFLEALAEVLLEDPRRFNSFWLSAQDPLRRSVARQRESFARILRAYWAHDFGSEEK